MPRAPGRAPRAPRRPAARRCEMRAARARDALPPSPRALRSPRALGSRRSPLSSRSPRKRNVSALVAFTFELSNAHFELGELLLSALEQFLLNLEVLAQHQVEPREPGGEHRLQVLLDVLCGRVAERLADALVQLVEKSLVDHGREATAPKSSAARSRVHQLSALLRLFHFKPLLRKMKFLGTGDAKRRRSL